MEFGRLVDKNSSYSNYYRFLSDLSEDAKAAVTSITNLPLDVRLALAAEKKVTPKKIGWAVAEFLIDVGWSVQHVAEVYQEIKECL